MVEPTWYLVGTVDIHTGKFHGMAIFSEETPTLSTKLFPFTMYSTKSYDDCVLAMNESAYFKWARDLCEPASRGWVRVTSSSTSKP